MSNHKAFFPGLNGLRFLAAVFVFLHHVEQHKYWETLPNLWGIHIVDNIGHQARVIFFVLSGFLITNLFLSEHEKTGTISWRNFQIRRALRLWPVYYLTAAIAIFVLPHFIDIGQSNKFLEVNFKKELIIYTLMLPNLARLLPPLVGANQFWSVGVQEQFYWLWPFLTRIFIRSFIPFLARLVLLKLMVEITLIHIIPSLNGTIFFKPAGQFLSIWQLLLFEQMAVGAAGAYLFFKNKKRILDFIFSKWLNAVTLIVFISLLFVITEFPGYTIIQGVIALILIMNISLNKNFFLKLESPVLDYLGNLSFAMYAYHTISIAIVLSILKSAGLYEDLVTLNILLYSGSLILTVALSALSYRYFENFFLNLKKKFQRAEKENIIPARKKVVESRQEEEVVA